MVEGGKAKTLPQYIAAVSVCLGAVAAGTVLGWTGNISDQLKHSEFHDININDDSLGWIGSFVSLGAMVTSFPIGFLCDFIGRKWTCLLTVIPFSLGWILIIFANNLSMLYAGRFLTGLAGGAFCIAAPIYTGEIAQTSIRGALGTYFQLLLTIGILIVYVAGAFMTPLALAILSAIIPLVFTVVFFFQPETPVYLLKRNKQEEAKKALQKLRGSSYDCDGELEEIKKKLDDSSSNQSSFMEVLTTKAGIKACIITFGLMSFQQLSGINAIILYTDAIFDAAGSSSLDPSTGTIIVGILQVAATFLSTLIVDRFGRKILLLISIIFMCLSEFVLGLYFSLSDRHLLDEDQIAAIGTLPVICLGVFIALFSLGFGPIPWMLAAEIMPQEIKSITCSAAASFNWFLSFIVTKFYSNLKAAIGTDVTFYIFSGICFVGAVFIVLMVPETKGKNFSEVQALLSGEKTVNETEGIDNPTFDNN